MDQLRQTIVLKEGDRFTGAGSGDQTTLRDKLLEGGVVKPATDGSLTVNFVGVAVVDALTIFFLPKVHLTSSPEKIQRQTVRALQTYARWIPSHHEASPHLNAEPDKGHVSGIAVANWLIADYLTHGLYRRTLVDFEINGVGRTNWQNTISMRQPIFSKGRPIYVETITRRSEDDPSNFATMLHVHLLEMLSREFGRLLGYEPIILDHEPINRFDLLPGAEECEHFLNAEIRTVYSDRSLQLLNMLIAAVKTTEIEQARDLALYGTSYFYNVWEAACGAVCGNEVSSWQMEMPAPIWRSPNGDEKSAETFRPDIVSPLNDTHSRMVIADAKYYRPHMPPNLGGVPGVNDVAKQIWYKWYLAKAAKDRGYSSIENIFLFPGSEGKLLKKIGSVEFPDGGDRVEAISLDFMQAIQTYSDQTDRMVKVFKSQLIEIVDGQIQSVIAQ